MNKDEKLLSAIHRATNGYYMDAAQLYTHALEDAKVLCEALKECRRRRDEISGANEANKRNAFYLRAQLASAHTILGELRDATQRARKFIAISDDEGFAAYNDTANAISLADEVLNKGNLSPMERQAMRGGLPEVTGGNISLREPPQRLTQPKPQSTP